MMKIKSLTATFFLAPFLGMMMMEQRQLGTVVVVQAFAPGVMTVVPGAHARSTMGNQQPLLLDALAGEHHHLRTQQLSTTTPTQLKMAAPANDQSSRSGPRVNLGLVRQTVFNQVLIGWTIWLPGGVGAMVLARDAHFTAPAIAMAIAGVIPLILVSQQIEKSESPAFADLNVSTNLLILRLFGDKPQPIVALVVSAFLSGLTGLVEEVTFRGELLPQIANWSAQPGNLPAGLEFFQGIPAGAALSTLLFAALHLNPFALFQGGSEGLKDGLVLVLYQIVTGGVFCFLYLASGNNLAVPIVAHALYDFYTFYNTHLEVTSQMEYASQAKLLPTSGGGVQAKWRQKRGDNFLLTCKESFFVADRNRDGVLSREELRIALYSYGIRLSAAESAAVTQAADADQSGTIDFDEFLEFVGPNGSTSKAIKQSLLGVNG